MGACMGNSKKESKELAINSNKPKEPS